MRVTPEDLRNVWNANRGEMLQCAGLGIRNRERLAAAALLLVPDLARWAKAVKRASESKFCTGLVKADGHEPFVADFDWLVKPDTLQLIEEGKFDNRGPREIEPPAPGEIQRNVRFETWRDQRGILFARRLS